MRLDACRRCGGLGDLDPFEEEAVITRALGIVEARLRLRGATCDAASVKTFLKLHSGRLPHEIFGVLFLDNGNRLIAYERMFRGTLTHTAVHPREIAKQALSLHAASVILHHNHPSGSCAPSQADIAITTQLQSALSLVDVTVLDHVITSDVDAFSMTEHGLLPTHPAKNLHCPSDTTSTLSPSTLIAVSSSIA